MGPAAALAGVAGPGGVPAGVVCTPDLVYHKVGATQLCLDLAWPAQGDGPFPGILIFNGGSWMDMGGDRKFCRELLVRLAQRGHVAVAVTHRSAAVAAFPAQLHDAKAAVRWLRSHAAKYRIDPERIGAVGFSSGGHLACLLGSTTPDHGFEGPDADPKVSSRVQAVVGCYAVSDLTQLRQQAQDGKPNRFVASITVGVLKNLLPDEKDVNWAVKGSPITYVHQKAAPTLLIHGTKDSVVPFAQSERYALRLKEVKARVELVAIDGAEHGFGSGYGGDAGRRCDDAVVEFLEQRFRKSSAHVYSVSERERPPRPLTQGDALGYRVAPLRGGKPGLSPRRGATR